MNKDLKKLLELETVDKKIIELENSKEEFPAEVESLEEVLANITTDIGAVETKIKSILSDKLALEEKIVDAKAALEKSQERISAIKTNKEYDAVHTEIESQKSLVENGNKKIEKFSAELEELNNILAEKKQHYEEQKAEHQPRIDELKSKISNIDNEIAEEIEKRETIARELPSEYLAPYNSIRKNRKNGNVISVITTAERTCTVCFQKLQPHMFNEARKASDIVLCQSCGSILVWQSSVVDSE